MSETTFISKDQNLRLVVEPKRNRMNPQTGEIYPTEGKVVSFGQDSPGNAGTFTTDDAETLKFLKDHAAFEADGPEGFVEEGAEPGRPEDPSDRLERIVELAVAKDTDGLEEIYLSERAGNSNPQVLKAAAKAIEECKGEVPAPPPVPEHQLERWRSPAVAHSPEDPSLVRDYPGEPVPAEGDDEKAKPKSRAKK